MGAARTTSPRWIWSAKANGEGRDQGRDRGRPASPAASPRARPGHAGHVRRLRPPEQHQGSDVYSLHIAAQCTFETAKCAFETAKCARSKQRSVHVRNSEVCTFETAKCALSCFSETARSKSRSRAPPAALRGRSPRGRRLGKSTPATSPERGGRSWASRPSRCAVAARALTPIHSGSAPQAPARGPLARFSSEGRVKGLVRPAAP